MLAVQLGQVSFVRPNQGIWWESQEVTLRSTERSRESRRSLWGGPQVIQLRSEFDQI